MNHNCHLHVVRDCLVIALSEWKSHILFLRLTWSTAQGAPNGGNPQSRCPARGFLLAGNKELLNFLGDVFCWLVKYFFCQRLLYCRDILIDALFHAQSIVPLGASSPPPLLTAGLNLDQLQDPPYHFVGLYLDGLLPEWNRKVFWGLAGKRNFVHASLGVRNRYNFAAMSEKCYLSFYFLDRFKQITSLGRWVPLAVVTIGQG